MNLKTITQHREPVPDCPQPDAPEIERGIRGPFNACMFKEECCQRADELDAARADTRRLDWMENFWLDPVCIYPPSHTREGFTFMLRGKSVVGRTMRDALDNAMERWPILKAPEAKP